MSSSPATNPPSDQDLLRAFPGTPPQSALLWTAVVQVAKTVDLGAAPKGHRFMVPILGGRFYAGDVDAGLAGTVLPGGADRQLLRTDGAKELDAIYEMQTEGGATLSIRNRVIVDPTAAPQRYAMSVIEVTAPQGPLDWLNRRVIAGTLQSARPETPAVIVRAWLLAPQASA